MVIKTLLSLYVQEFSPIDSIQSMMSLLVCSLSSRLGVVFTPEGITEAQFSSAASKQKVKAAAPWTCEMTLS